MKIVIGSDHRGFELKERLAGFLSDAGHDIEDVGTESRESVDYPVYAEKAAEQVREGKADRGILICGSGLGMCMAANKVEGIRGATARTAKDAEMAVRHNNANMICLGADVTGYKKARKIIERYLGQVFEGGRHLRRINKISEIEKK